LPKAKIAEARQVVEIPPIKPIITEHQAMKCRCANCGKQVRANLPSDVTSSVFGPKIKAWCTVLSGKFHLSKNQIKELFGTLLGISIAKGSVINIHYQAALMLQHPYEEALQILRDSNTTYADETSWRTKGQTKWLWQATDKSIVIFKVFASRGKKAFHSLLGKDVVQNLVTDRLKTYSTSGLHQYCWAHLKRDFKRIEQRSGLVSMIGKLMGSLCSFLFKCTQERERGEMSEEDFIEKAKEIKDEFHYLFKLGLRADTHNFKLGITGRFCERILSDEDKLWAFIEDSSLDLTNNLSERNLRPAVLWRKISFGNKSARGEQFVERILSVVETVKIQGRNILDYLVACFSARSKCLTIPSFVCIN
jgi:transposase